EISNGTAVAQAPALPVQPTTSPTGFGAAAPSSTNYTKELMDDESDESHWLSMPDFGHAFKRAFSWMHIPLLKQQPGMAGAQGGSGFPGIPKNASIGGLPIQVNGTSANPLVAQGPKPQSPRFSLPAIFGGRNGQASNAGGGASGGFDALLKYLP